MNEMLIKWLPLVAALIAGIFALTQMRANNITNARIKWLEHLRQLITDFFAECGTLQFKEGIIKGIHEKSKTEITPEHVKALIQQYNGSFIEHFKIIETKHHLIKLNLNPKEQLHQKLEAILDDYMKLFNKIPLINSITEYDALTRSLEARSDTMILLSRYIMKIEWEKTKRASLPRIWYVHQGKGKQLLQEALNLQLLPEREPYIRE